MLVSLKITYKKISCVAKNQHLCYGGFNLRDEMGIYYTAIDFEDKLKINPPENFAIKCPALFHPLNPFSGMIIMMNSRGHNFGLIDDFSQPEAFYSKEYKNITESVFKEYNDMFPDFFNDDID